VSKGEREFLSLSEMAKKIQGDPRGADAQTQEKEAGPAGLQEENQGFSYVETQSLISKGGRG